MISMLNKESPAGHILTFGLDWRGEGGAVGVDVLLGGGRSHRVTVGVEHSEVLRLLTESLRHSPALLLLHQAALSVLLYLRHNLRH